MRRSIVKISVYAIFLILIVLLSEFLYTINSKSALLDFYYFKRAQMSAGRGSAQEAVDFLVKWAELDMRNKKGEGFQESGNSQPVLNRYPNEIKLGDNGVLNKSITSYLSSIKFTELFFYDNYSLSRIFYDLAVLSFQNKSEYLFPRFSQTAINLNPRHSFLYVELANFYYYYGQKDVAEDILLDKCKPYETSTNWCEDYYNKHIKNGDYPLTPGFLVEESGRFYNYPSLLSTLSSL